MYTTLHSTENFSLSEGGPIHDAMLKMHLQNQQGKLAVVGLCITWLPLVIITAFEGTLYSATQLPFLQDVAMQARILVALPMLIMIKITIDSKVIVVTKYLADALMSLEERQEILTTAFRKAKKLTGSALAEIILLLIVIGATINFVKGGVFGAIGAHYGQTTSWMYHTKDGNPMLSVAGYWAIIVSIPIFQFFLLRWLWRYFIWILLLFRLSKAKLNLLPTHPDRAGGLGIVMLSQRSFNLIFVAGSVVISGQFIAQIIQDPDFFNTIRVEVIGYIIICIICILIPLLFFTGKLSNT